MKQHILLLVMCFHMLDGQELSLPEYVVSECYGDTFNFDCGTGNMIRINRDFFGYNDGDTCDYMQGDCTMSNPKSNSLIHRFCTGKRWCTYYMVERRACDGYFSNYQQVEYQCIPETKVTNICEDVEFRSHSTYISSPNFPNNYPPNLDCSCMVTTNNPAVRVQMEIVFLAIKFNKPCNDWLKIGKKKTCGTTVDLYSGRAIPIKFHSDREGSHSGFWLHFQSSDGQEPLVVKCGKNITSNYTKLRKRPTPPTEKPRPANFFRVPSAQDSAPTRRQYKGHGQRNVKAKRRRTNPFIESRKHPHLPPSMDIPDAKTMFPDPRQVSSRPSQLSNPKVVQSSPTRPQASTVTKQNRAPKGIAPSTDNTLSTNPDTPALQKRPSMPIQRSSQAEVPPERTLTNPDKPRHQLTTTKVHPKQIPRQHSVGDRDQITAKPTALILQLWTDQALKTTEDIEATSLAADKSSEYSVPTTKRKTFKRTEAAVSELSTPSIQSTQSTDLEMQRSKSPDDSSLDKGANTNDIKTSKVKQQGKEKGSEETFLYSDVRVSDHDHIEEEFITDSDYMEYYYYPGNIGGNFSATAQTEHTTEATGVTFGFIIICICVFLLIILIAFVVTVVLCRRKRLGKNEPRHSIPSPNPPSSDISTQDEPDNDNDSGRGLLASAQKVDTVKQQILPTEPPQTDHPSYTKGTGHQSYVDVDSLYAKPIKSGRSSSSAGNHSSGQSDAYEDVVVRQPPSINTHSPVECTDSDGSLYCTPTPANFLQGSGATGATYKHSLTKSVTAPGNLAQSRHRRRKQRGNRGIRRSGSASSLECFSGSGHSESDNSFSEKHRHKIVSLKPKLPHHRILSDSEPDLYSNSEPEMDLLRKRSIASMSELAEVTFVPDFEHATCATNELDLSISEPSDDLETDWETRSAISI